MARRATAISDLKESAKTRGPLLLIAGPYEFLPYDDTEKRPDVKTFKPLSAAYDRFAYDLVCLAPEEAKALTDQGVAVPKDWIVLGDEPQSRIIPKDGLKIGVLFFPMAEKADEPPSDMLMGKVDRAAKELREKSDVIVGVSPWGIDAEEAFSKLKKGSVDVLLGAGPGSGIYARPVPYGEAIWTRAYAKGKALNEVELMALPSADAAAGNDKFLWELNKNFKAVVLPLDDKIAQDADIQKLF